MSSLILGWPLRSELATAGDPSAFRHGRRDMSRQDLGHAVTYEHDGHLITFAPTGAGKGVSVIIPNLLHYDGPIIVIDPKGENFAVTAQYRKAELNQSIILLDPFHAVPNEEIERVGVARAGLNPLDLSRDMRGSIPDQSIMLAELIGGDHSHKKDPFWDLEAKKLIAGVIALLMETGNRTGIAPPFSALIEALFGKDGDPIYSLDVMLDTLKPSDFATKMIGNFLEMPSGNNGQRGGVLSTAQSYFGALVSEETSKYLATSTLSIEKISGRDDYTIYIVIPPAKLVSHAQLLRLWVGTLLNAIMERKRKPEKRTLFLLDECAQLGSMDALRKAVTLLRGYGLQVWMFFQDLSQVMSLYQSDHLTLINNCGVLQAFGVTRSSAAAPIAKLVGRISVKDLAGLVRSQQLLSIAGERPKFARLADYRTDRPFEHRAARNFLFATGAKARRRTKRFVLPIYMRDRL